MACATFVVQVLILLSSCLVGWLVVDEHALPLHFCSQKTAFVQDSTVRTIFSETSVWDPVWFA